MIRGPRSRAGLIAYPVVPPRARPITRTSTPQESAPPRAGDVTGGEGPARAVRWVVTGRVQGVGFRWFVKRRAERLGIRGRVTNLPDGRVEILALGTSDSLAAFETAVRDGPRLAHVESVDKSDIPHEMISSNTFDTF